MKKIEKVINNFDDKIFFIKKNNMSKKKFLKKFNVKNNSYLYNLYSRLYDYIIGNCFNLYDEFKKYYKKEYLKFDIFLSEHYNMPEKLIKEYNNKKSYYKYKDVGNEQPLYPILRDEEVRNIVCEFVGGFVYED